MVKSKKDKKSGKKKPGKGQTMPDQTPELVEDTAEAVVETAGSDVPAKVKLPAELDELTEGEGITPETEEEARICWPDGAKLAVQVTILFSATGLDENDQSPWAASDAYAVQAGFPRLAGILTERGIPATVFTDIATLRSAQTCVATMQEADWEIATTGLGTGFTIDDLEERRERADYLAKCVEEHTALTGVRPFGFYAHGADPDIRDLLMEEGGFLYDSLTADADHPYWAKGGEGQHLVIPMAEDTTDFFYADDHRARLFNRMVRDAARQLISEKAEKPPMLSIVIDPAITGRPAWAAAFSRTLDKLAATPDIWFARRLDIAWHWHAMGL